MISSSAESCHLLRRDNILELFTGAQVLGIKGKMDYLIVYFSKNLFKKLTYFKFSAKFEKKCDFKFPAYLTHLKFPAKIRNN